MLDEVTCGENTKRHVFMQLPDDLARAEHARGVALDEHFDPHDGVEGPVARATAAVVDEEGVQPSPPNRSSYPGAGESPPAMEIAALARRPSP